MTTPTSIDRDTELLGESHFEELLDEHCELLKDEKMDVRGTLACLINDVMDVCTDEAESRSRQDQRALLLEFLQPCGCGLDDCLRHKTVSKDLIRDRLARLTGGE